MRKNILTLTVMAVLALMLNSCTKISGCTDAKATNFSAEAEEDCNCCTYESNLVFWYNQATATWLVSVGSTTLTYYVDDKIVGSGAANIYWTGAPDCSQNASITITKSLGESKSKAYTYKVIDQDGDTIWEGIHNFDANTCFKLQLTH